ncbi:MAG: PD40 domain-containing protein [Chitinophagales bacterium]|nr:PD40 domain-containing protein [Chitinophagales bacterium]
MKSAFIILACILSGSIFLIHPFEPHLTDIKQLTHGGTNAEAYFSPDGEWLTMQTTRADWGYDCDQILLMDIKAAKTDTAYRSRLISIDGGRTTCSYFLPDGNHLLFASTKSAGAICPATPPHDPKNYVWPIYDSYDIYESDLEGHVVKQLTNTNGYDAEATVSPKGDKIVFTSTRGGDIDLWGMNIDGSNPVQITNETGYDGGATFSPDGSKIVYRACHPKSEEEVKAYRDFLSQGLVSPLKMELFICNADGSNKHQLTELGNANWAPCFDPTGKKIVFSSNAKSSGGFDFQLFAINIDGTGLQQITDAGTFNAFPMFSPDGKNLVFCSNRNSSNKHEIDVYLSKWIP